MKKTLAWTLVAILSPLIGLSIFSAWLDHLGNQLSKWVFATLELDEDSSEEDNK